MSIVLAVALLLGGSPSAATAAPPDNSFTARVLRGKLVEAGATGPAYQKQLWAQLNTPLTKTLERCIASHTPANKAPFTVVLNVGSDGSLSEVEAQPATPVAACVVTWFATTTLPVPPTLPNVSSYPLEIDVSIVP
ncbi:MAG: peptidase C13 [Rhodanobacter sp.]